MAVFETKSPASPWSEVAADRVQDAADGLVAMVDAVAMHRADAFGPL